MLYIWNLFLISSYCYISVECLIPTLNVQKLDNKMIERKRQDTLDMCRMFTEENERLEHSKSDVGDHNFIDNHKRAKRELKIENNDIDVEEAKRVENIVDKLYDDLAEKGSKVTYRQRTLQTTTATVPLIFQNESARRFEFAPAELLPPVPTANAPAKLYEPSMKFPWLKKWKHGIVPFFIDPNTYDTHLSEIIMKAFDYFEKATCIRLQRLRERPTDKESLQNVEWLYITNPSGIKQCVHSNERKENSGVQMVVFGYDCLSLGEILHEIMHILGFSHEHTRPDRDQHITVLWDNIKPGYKKYFEIRSEDPLSSLPYDFSSVLHYPSRAFSKNGQVTLLAEPGVKFGQRERLSDVDIAKVTTVYGSECVERNRKYLLNTCPSVVNMKKGSNNVTRKEIEDYFKDRLWPYGIVNYKIKDKMEFSIEERENINAVIRHIEKETCIEFRDTSTYDVEESVKNDGMDTNYNVVDEDKKNSNPTGTDNKQIESGSDNAIITNTKPSKISKINLQLPNEIDDTDITNIELDNSERFARKQIGTNSSFSKNIEQSSTQGTFGSTLKNKSPSILDSKPSLSRRHAASSLSFVRSLEPGCQCPPPGKPKGNQVLKINVDCFNSVNDLLHLFVHILGLDHQHNMHDRDSFLHILWSNLTKEISDEMQAKLPAAAAIGFPYDYQSVMHYPWLQIKNGVTNIMYPIWNDGWAMGHWQGLSSTDVKKLSLIYYEQCSLRKQQANE